MLDSCLDGLQICVRCCQPFVTEAASGVSDVDPNGHVVRLSCVRFSFLRWSSVVVLWLGFSLSFVVSEIDHGLLRSIRFLRWISCSLLTLFGIRRRCVSALDLAGVVVGTFSC